VDFLGRQPESADQVVHVQNIAHLLAVAVNRDGFAGQRGDEEVS
jgi:hypothetical protein